MKGTQAGNIGKSFYGKELQLFKIKSKFNLILDLI